jgi:uncharacterized damage-inducible protein DinB
MNTTEQSEIKNDANGVAPGVRLLPIDFDGMAQCDADHTQRILDAAMDILSQGEDLLRALPAEIYAQRVPAVFNASIGGHYRHCLDHFTSLLLALDADEVDYDHRKRDARIETQPDFALRLTSQMRRTFEDLTPGALYTEVKARCEVSYTHSDSSVTHSTLARELVYCIAHAIHHYALISVMARLMAVKLPKNFGVAPSTVTYQNAGRK